MYEFRKGEGWVALAECGYVTLKCGTNVKVEQRKPNIGERFHQVWSGSPAAKKFGLNPQGMANWMHDYTYNSIPDCVYDVADPIDQAPYFVVTKV